MRPAAPLLDQSLPPSSSSPLPIPPGGSLPTELPPQPISVSPSHNHAVNHDVNPPDSSGVVTPGVIPPVSDYQQLPPPDGHSFVIQKIKESMQEEAKRFNEEKLQPIDAADESKREYYWTHTVHNTPYASYVMTHRNESLPSPRRRFRYPFFGRKHFAEFTCKKKFSADLILRPSRSVQKFLHWQVFLPVVRLIMSNDLGNGRR